MTKQEIQDLMVNNLVPNKDVVSDDKKKLKRKGIKSPDHTKMDYRIFDTSSQTTYYFLTREKYESKAQELSKVIDPKKLKFSHPWQQ